MCESAREGKGGGGGRRLDAVAAAAVVATPRRTGVPHLFLVRGPVGCVAASLTGARRVPICHPPLPLPRPSSAPCGWETRWANQRVPHRGPLVGASGAGATRRGRIPGIRVRGARREPRWSCAGCAAGHNLPDAANVAHPRAECWQFRKSWCQSDGRHGRLRRCGWQARREQARSCRRRRRCG